MKRHPRDNYFVVNENLVYTLDQDGQPRSSSPTDKAALRKFRFSRIGPKGPPMDHGLRAILGLSMVQGANQPDSAGPIVPAGYTYLGQFVDHDLTFDKTAASLGQNVSVSELEQGRSPALDLDCMYGRGPNDLEDAKFYLDGIRLRDAASKASPAPISDPITITDVEGGDLLRVGNGSLQSDRIKAVIPDPRNDENLAVAQTHLAFIHFHNQVVESLSATGMSGQGLFVSARDTVVKHYQWMLRHDYLPRIVEPAIVDEVFSNGRKIFEVNVPDGDSPTMPIEFSVAAFRLGHSQIRDNYQWNRVFRQGGAVGASLNLLFQFSGTSGSMLPGFDRLPTNWIADFRRLYDFSSFNIPELNVPAGELNLAKKLDTLLVDPLNSLPPVTVGASPGDADVVRNLAFRNLTRADMVSLATGQQMAALVAAQVPGIQALSADQITVGNAVNLTNIPPEKKAKLVNETPLWFYILREAELNGGRLTGVGGQIVAEVFHRAMAASSSSIVRESAWRPTLGRTAGEFDMPDLIFFAFKKQAALIALLG